MGPRIRRSEEENRSRRHLNSQLSVSCHFVILSSHGRRKPQPPPPLPWWLSRLPTSTTFPSPSPFNYCLYVSSLPLCRCFFSAQAERNCDIVCHCGITVLAWSHEHERRRGGGCPSPRASCVATGSTAENERMKRVKTSCRDRRLSGNRWRLLDDEDVVRR